MSQNVSSAAVVISTLMVNKDISFLIEPTKMFAGHTDVPINETVVHCTRCHIFMTRLNVGPSLNPYKPSVLFVGHRQTVQNQITRRKTRLPIRFSTVCLQKFLLKFE